MKAEIELIEDDETIVTVYKDNEEIMTFSSEENLGDIYYNIINMLRALDVEVVERGMP